MAGESQQVPESKPDPSVIATEQMLLAVGNLEKLMQTDIEGLEKLFEARLDTHRAVCAEQFESIRTQLDLIERQRVEQKKDTKDAVDAALAAAKAAVQEQTAASEKAVDKSERASQENVKQQGNTFSLLIAGLTTSLGDMKDAFTRELSDMKLSISRIDSMKAGAVEVTTSQRLNLGAVWAAAGVLIGFAGLAVAITVAFTR
jgi:hypothetical protein